MFGGLCMTDLTPAGQAALQTWAAHCFSTAFSVGLLSGLLLAAGVAAGAALHRALARRLGDLRLDHQFRQWERGPEAAVLRAQALAEDAQLEAERVEAMAVHLRCQPQGVPQEELL